MCRLKNPSFFSTCNLAILAIRQIEKYSYRLYKQKCLNYANLYNEFCLLLENQKSSRDSVAHLRVNWIPVYIENSEQKIPKTNRLKYFCNQKMFFIHKEDDSSELAKDVIITKKYVFVISIDRKTVGLMI